MSRTRVLNLLKDYQPDNSQEIVFKERMMDFIERYTECFERSLLIGHVTASALLINKEGTHCLLMHHAKLNQWFQLGGHCDGDSDVARVALREAQEESGINNITLAMPGIFDIDIHTIPANSKEPEHDHYDIRFLLKVTSDENIIQNSESKELRWIANADSQMPSCNESVVRMVNKWGKLHL